MPSLRKRLQNQPPEINLVPMMDVLMTVLTFFIIITMILQNLKAVNVPIPSSKATPSPQEKLPEPLIVELSATGQTTVGNTVVSRDQLPAQIRTYLAKNPKGAVLLKPTRNMKYEQVVQVLGELQDAGGERVSLALED